MEITGSEGTDDCPQDSARLAHVGKTPSARGRVTRADLLSENEALRQKTRLLRRRLEELKATAATNRERDRAALERLHRKIGDLLWEKHTILSSTTWIVTAPVRRVSTLLPRSLRKFPRLLLRVLGLSRQPQLIYPRAKAFLEDQAAVRQLSERPTANQRLQGAITLLAWQHAPDPVVIVPVYNAPNELERCADALFRHTKVGVRIVFVDDASTDPQVQVLLARFEAVEGVSVVRNPTNLGFTRTVNRGISLAEGNDVVLLNSDTIVTPLWLTNLRTAAYSADRIGTVTPLSNNAGAFSAPEIGTNSIEGIDLDAYARLVTRESQAEYPRVPTGHGFCLYVRRACLDEVGLLDEATFPYGYGEENDFCMRAGKSGWSHAIDDRTIVFHTQAASFGDRRAQLLKSSSKTIHARYPEYRAETRVFTEGQEISRCRKRVGHALKKAKGSEAVLPRALFVISTTTGGTPQTNGDLMSALADRYDAFLLRCNASMIEFSRIVEGRHELVDQVRLENSIKAVPHTSDEYDAFVQQLITDHAIEIVHIRHIAWHSLNLVSLCRKLGVPVVFSFHDFYTVCPTIKLLDDQLRFCGGRCTGSLGECKPELWRDPTLLPLKHNSIKHWQESMGEMLSYGDYFVTTSPGAKEIVQKTYPNVADDRFEVIPHGRDLVMEDRRRSVARQPGEPLRILVPGNISDPKGAQVIARLAEIDRGHHFQFHILGATTLQPRPGIVMHGSYEREEFSRRVEPISPDIGAIFSIWPETYCHTLTEMWAAGLPVVGFDIGAVGERLRQHGGGWLVGDFTAEAVASCLRRVSADQDDYAMRLSQVRMWQSGYGAQNTTGHMADAYHRVYQRALARRAS